MVARVSSRAHRFGICVVVASFFGLTSPAAAHHVGDWSPGGGTVVACLGDSNTVDFDQAHTHTCGSPDTTVTTWCTRLASQVAGLGWTVRNHGVPGATVVSPNPLAPGFTSTASQQLTAALAVSPPPDVFVLSFGTNDIRAGRSVADVVAAYKSVKQTIEAGGRRAVIATTPPTCTVDTFGTPPVATNPVIAQLNEELKAVFPGADDLVDLGSGLVPGTSGASADYGDCVHMNNCGQEKRGIAIANQLTHQHDFFTLSVIDKTTSAPIAGVTLTTTNGIVYTSDATGTIEVYEPGLMQGSSVYVAMPTCVDKPNSNPATKWCDANHAITCTTNAQCNQNHEPVGVPFFGSCFVGARLNVFERGTAQVRLCPAGTSPVCPAAPGPGQCVSDVVAGANLANPVPDPTQQFEIQVTDAATGRGVPLIEVHSPTTTYVTDSAGLVAFSESALMGTTVHFDIAGHGYAATSANLTAVPGGGSTVPITRVNVAERLYRITGGGIYRDSLMLDEPTPIAAPMINRQVFGQDSNLATVYQNKIFWIWGDTGRPSFPLGSFRSPGAVSDLPASGGLDPSLGVDLTYFGDNAGFVSAGMCSLANFPNTPGFPSSTPCWMSNLTTVTDGNGVERMYARYYIVNSGESGLGRFNDATKTFDKMLVYPSTMTVDPIGDPDKVKHGTTSWLYFEGRGVTGYLGSIPVDSPVRIQATETKIQNPSQYQAFTAIRLGTTDELTLRSDGTLQYAWRANTPAVTGSTGSIYNGGPIPNDQKLFAHSQEPDTGALVSPSNASTVWNPYRQRYTQIMQQVFGTSFLGETWFTEADTPMGPWVYARKIVSHNNYSFYNPRQHAFFNQQNGRLIYFENTYTTYLTDAVPTPRDNYNQFMYRLDLDDTRVVLPVPVYDLTATGTPGTLITKRELHSGSPDVTPAFMAPDRAGMTGSLPVWWNDASCRTAAALLIGGTPTTTPIFWALPGNAGSPPPTTVPLWDYLKSSSGAHAYSVDPNLALSGFTRLTNPLARVWASPIRVKLPVPDYLAPLVADAGNDKCLNASNTTGTATFSLSGIGSKDTVGTITSYQWTWAGGGSASGTSPSVTLPPGLYDITLTIASSNGQTSKDNVIVSIIP